jgi:hypothetical protein
MRNLYPGASGPVGGPPMANSHHSRAAAAAAAAGYTHYSHANNLSHMSRYPQVGKYIVVHSLSIRHGPFFENIFFEKFEFFLPFFEKIEKKSKKICFTKIMN